MDWKCKRIANNKENIITNQQKHMYVDRTNVRFVEKLAGYFFVVALASLDMRPASFEFAEWKTDQQGGPSACFIYIFIESPVATHLHAMQLDTSRKTVPRLWIFPWYSISFKSCISI